MAGHGCLVPWCFNVCNSISQIFKPGDSTFNIQIKAAIAFKAKQQNPCNINVFLPGQSGFNQVKPAKKKVAEEEKKAPNLPYTQILKMVQVIEFFAVCSH